MLCKNPYMAGTIPFGCGQCLPCRVNRRRQWMWRQFFESLSHEENCFVTLTYDDVNLPTNGCLDARVLQLWIKRIRKVVYPRKLRYFGVGEYGDKSGRPHFHLSMFGVSGLTPIDNFGGRPFEQAVAATWGKGYVQVAEFNELTAGYVCGYVVKKMTSGGDPRLEGRTPEFARMSNRPGIGADAMSVIAKQLLDMPQSWESGDVPHELRIGKKKVPLGRYLLKRLRHAVGFSEEYTKEVRDRLSLSRSVDMLALLHNSKEAGTFKAAFLEEIEGRLAQVEARSKLFKKRDTL